ncbi:MULTISPECIES: outer membrane beta-barrel protein [unclassified Campylobacter]|uniref:outer membrane beta-barrel protein n=1 Tax=unclassified Campylobacter TaxID=2593542 RepID=UPI003D343B18
MKDIVIKTLLLGSLVAVGAMAEDRFIGVEVGYDKSILKGNIDDKEDISSGKSDDTRANIGFKIGQDLESYRIYGSYIYDTKASESGKISNTNDNYSINWKKHKLLVGVDFTPEISQNFRALLGVYTGLAIANIDLNMPITSNSTTYGGAYAKNLKGWVVGGKVGGLYDFDEQSELEFGVKAEYTKYKNFDIGSANFKFKETAYGPYLGYNYKF